MRTQYIFTQLKPSMTLYRRLSPADIALLSVLTLSCALLPFPRVDPSPYYTQASALASTFRRSGFDCPVGTLHINLQTARTAAGHPASTNAVWREHLTPAAAADAVSPCDGRGLPPNVLRMNVHGCTVHAMARRPSHLEGVHRVPLIVYARRPLMDLEVDDHLRRRRRQFPLLSAFYIERSGTETLIPRRVTIVWIAPPVGSRPRP